MSVYEYIIGAILIVFSLLIIFVVLLFFSLLQELGSFIYSLYREFSLRL